ncbi:ATP-dependent rna [Cyclospora cayetanensis]|uniref:ATP-dependent rna n=1 Tax=Cyclospora cayetanensis TaxID=88456 RepID=A0A1D3DAA0_9EIME|nr:ATP-dependent rna [Cyclospora cayetanensis]
MDAFFEREPKGKRPEPARPKLSLQEPQPPQQEEAHDVDPLDAFMAGLNETLVREKAEFDEKQRREAAGEALQMEQERFFDDEDIAADSMEHLNTQKAMAAEAARSKRKAQPQSNSAATDDEDEARGRALPVVNHDRILYPSYTVDIYEEHSDVSSLSLEAVASVRDSLQLHTTGKQAPRPIASFLHLKGSLPKGLWSALQRRDYRLPTAVQAAAIPALLRGRDCLAMAQTGSGKTVAYLLPLLTRVVHLKEKDHWATRRAADSSSEGAAKREQRTGPSAIIICPTRELAVQVDGEVHSFTRGGTDLDVSRLLLAGGFDKTEQFRSLRRGPDVVVGNPGRIIDVCSLKGLGGIFEKIVMVVVDEADKMVQMGFEAQLREVLCSIRPDRITCMVSATMPRKCEALANRFLRNPIRIVVGEGGQAAQSVHQRVQIVDGEPAKFDWLSKHILGLLALSQKPEQMQQHQQSARPPPATVAAAASAGGVIFCSSQQRVEDLAFLLDNALAQQVENEALTAAGQGAPGTPAPIAVDAASRAAAARLLKGDSSQDLKKNANQTFKYVAILHGGMQQGERLAVMRRMQHHFLDSPGSVQSPLVLVATDVAARGLDFPPALSLVVCYDAPNDPEVYVHRVGRAGRAGHVGLACSLFTKQEKRQAAFVVEKMEASGQTVPRSLLEFAMQFPPFREARLSGLRVVWQGGKAGRELRHQQNTSFGGLGYAALRGRNGLSWRNPVQLLCVWVAISLSSEVEKSAGTAASVTKEGREKADLTLVVRWRV